jgi:AcrR family transcriptional regulator
MMLNPCQAGADPDPGKQPLTPLRLILAFLVILTNNARMHIPARILRSHLMDIDRTLRDLTAREQAREERILRDAQFLIARFGAAALTFTNLAIAMKIAPATLRRHFADFDALLGEIMRRHLRAIASAIGEIPHDAPNRARLQRAAYITATRTLGAPTEAHLILTTHRTTLPEDERASVAGLRGQIGLELGGTNGEATLYLLDCPHFTIDQIEPMLEAAAQPVADVPKQAAAPPPTPGGSFHLIADLSDISGVALPGGLLMESLHRGGASRGPPLVSAA